MLDPQARALIDLMTERGVPPTHTLAPAEARRLYRERRAYVQPAAITMAAIPHITCFTVVLLFGQRLTGPDRHRSRFCRVRDAWLLLLLSTVLDLFTCPRLQLPGPGSRL